MMAKIHYNIFTNENAQSRVSPGPEFGRCHMINNNDLSEAGIPMLEVNEIMDSNQVHCRSMSYINIKCSREQYTTYLHLKIIS
jgi:hypothetical protein